MIKETYPIRDSENLRGGRGVVRFTDLVSAEETYGHVRLFSRVVLEPGCSMGYHTHEEETEFYYILSGTPTVSDNGVQRVMTPGQVMVTGHGDGHSMENRTDTPVEFLAVIVLA